MQLSQRRPRALLVLLTLLSFAATACGNDDPSTNTATGDSTSSTAAAVGEIDMALLDELGDERSGDADGRSRLVGSAPRR